MKNKPVTAEAPGAEAKVEITPEVMKEWVKRDLGSAIVFLQAILSEEAVLHEIIAVFESRVAQRDSLKAAEGRL